MTMVRLSAKLLERGENEMTDFDEYDMDAYYEAGETINEIRSEFWQTANGKILEIGSMSARICLTHTKRQPMNGCLKKWLCGFLRLKQEENEMTLFITLGDILNIIGFVLAVLSIAVIWWSSK